MNNSLYLLKTNRCKFNTQPSHLKTNRCKFNTQPSHLHSFLANNFTSLLLSNFQKISFIHYSDY